MPILIKNKIKESFYINSEVYNKDALDCLLEEDEISPEEAAFMNGYSD